MEKISLYDKDNDKMYDLILSADDARRAASDITFATTLLNAAIVEKNQRQQTEMQKDSEVIIQETTASDNDAQSADSCEESSLYRWTESCVLLLLRTYQEMEQTFINGKTSHKKCWELVAKSLKNQGHSITGPQCSSKLRSLKKTYKSIKEHNAKSGNDRRIWQHFEIMEEIFSKKAWCKPVAVASSTGLSAKNIDTEVLSSISCSNDDSVDDVENKVLSAKVDTKTRMSVPRLLQKRLAQREIHEQKKQKRHEDKIAVEEKLLDALMKF